jgi:hypothetical protein
MTSLSKVWSLCLTFSAAGLIGPAIHRSTWPPSEFSRAASESVVAFVSDLVFLLWPAHALAVVESSTGAPVASVLAVVANARGYAVAYALVAGVIVMLAFWGAGFSTEHLSIAAVSIALVIYAAPFYIASRVAP